MAFVLLALTIALAIIHVENKTYAETLQLQAPTVSFPLSESDKQLIAEMKQLLYQQNMK